MQIDIEIRLIFEDGYYHDCLILILISTLRRKTSGQISIEILVKKGGGD